MDAETEKKLQILIDKDEIRDVMLKHARALDRSDPELFKSLFHPDAVRLTTKGEEPGPTGQLRAIAAVKPDEKPYMHFIGNQLIEVEGDVAYAESYFVSYREVAREHLLEEERIALGDADAAQRYTRTRAGRYLDRLEKRDGQWKIVWRMMTGDWSRMDPVGKQVDRGHTSFPGKPDATDPLYKLIARSG